jgi:hypothetical protein
MPDPQCTTPTHVDTAKFPGFLLKICHMAL